MATARETIEGSPDLKQLHVDGFEISIRESRLLVSSVPYLTSDKTVARGTLIFTLVLATDTMAGKPPNHEAHFAGEKPHYADGTPIAGIIHSEGKFELAKGIVAKFHLSSRPEQPDPDYNAKVRRYVDVISAPARVIEPGVTAQTCLVVESEVDDSPFVFPDTHSARAEISLISDKLKNLKIAIVGLGGTGSYVLDFVAKTPVKEIHLFDDDEYSVHNIYRSPGTPTRDQLRARMFKVDYFREVYSRMHRGVVAHTESLSETNSGKLAGMNFAFLCMDPGPEKAQLVTFLVNNAIPFADTGLGVEKVDNKLIGMVTVVAVTPEYKGHLHKIPIKSGGADDLYASNIQMAELNALNAVLAVIRWKKHFGFYADDRHEHECLYTIGSNSLNNEETQP